MGVANRTRRAGAHNGCFLTMEYVADAAEEREAMEE